MKIHSTLKNDSWLLGRFKLSAVLLMKEKIGPWLILVPQTQKPVTDLYQLSEKEQLLFLQESNLISNLLNQCFQTDKINIASIGEYCFSVTYSFCFKTT